MRNKFSKLTLAAAIVLAMAFTLSCSDDKDEGGTGTGACKHTGKFQNSSIEICESLSLAAIGITVDQYKRECESDAAYNGSTFLVSCPGGYVKTCKNADDDFDITYYLYDEALANVDCDTFFRYYDN